MRRRVLGSAQIKFRGASLHATIYTGLGVATESFQRLLVVFLLYLLLDAKSAYEERELERIHPAYRAYKQVTPKFFPSFDELDEILD